MDILLYAAAVSLPVLAFVIGKAIHKRRDGFSAEKKPAPRVSYAKNFLAGAAFAVVMFCLTAAAAAAVANLRFGFSPEYACLLAVSVLAGYFVVKLARKLAAPGARVPFLFGTIAGSTGIWSFSVFQEAFSSRGAADWYGDFFELDLLGAVMLIAIWIAFVALSCLSTIIFIMINIIKTRKESDVK